MSTEQRIQENSEPKGFLQKIRRGLNSLMTGSHFPTEAYTSTLSLYGGVLTDIKGKRIWMTEGELKSGDLTAVHRKGDALARTFDDHYARRPIHLLRRRMREQRRAEGWAEVFKHPKWFTGTVFPGAKRESASLHAVLDHIHELGLDEYYGPHEEGVEIKKPELFTQGFALQDIFRTNEIEGNPLEEIDRFEALARATSYVRAIHDHLGKKGGIGTIGVESFIFDQMADTQTGDKKVSDGQTVSSNPEIRLDKPVLMVPTVPFNPNKRISETEQKATDMLDFMASIGNAEFRRSGDWDNVRFAMDIILENYGKDKKVIEAIISLARRGRLTLPGETSRMQSWFSKPLNKVLSLHNVQRLGGSESTSEFLRKTVIGTSDRVESTVNRQVHEVFALHNIQRFGASQDTSTKWRNTITSAAEEYLLAA